MRREDPIKRAHLEGAFARGNPPQFVLPNPSTLVRMQVAVKRSENLHLSVMNQVSKHYVPLDDTVGVLHIIHNGRLPASGNVKQTRK
jgi:hypothetical protein